jgi:hypothetical protein
MIALFRRIALGEGPGTAGLHGQRCREVPGV